MNTRTWLRDNVFSVGKRMLARSEIARYFEDAYHAWLNLGCGGNRIPGWLNADRFPPPGAIFVDAAKRLPFDDACFAAILYERTYCEVSRD